MKDINIYFDNAATTRTDDRVLKAMLPFLSTEFGNASGKYSLGYKSRKAVENAREKVADLIGAEPDEIFFTSGGTESNNTVLTGGGWREICTTGIEHPSILNTLKRTENTECKVRVIQCNKTGVVDISETEKLLKAIGGTGKLLSVMLINNELGVAEPIEKLAETAHVNGFCFHTDAVQAVGHSKIDVRCGIDFLSASAHKFYGPKGIGFLYIKRGMKLNPLVIGGGQEKGIRSGTENVPGIVGMGVACEIAKAEMEENGKKEKEVIGVLRERLLSIPDSFIIGDGERILNIAFKGINGTSLALRLDVEGVCVSTGSACSSGLEKRSHVLDFLGIEPEYADASIRISVGKYNTMEEAVTVSEKISRLVAELRELTSA